MKPWLPAVIVHGRQHAEMAAALGRPATLLSAPWAAAYAGCLWWRAVVRAAALAHPGTQLQDMLDCGDLAGRALEALRAGQSAIVLRATCPAYDSIVERAAALGAIVIAEPPPALDLAKRGAARLLAEWLADR